MNQFNISSILSSEYALRHRTWAEINLDAAEQKFKTVRALAPNSGICCIIKANAYGHGAIMLARLYETLGAAYLAVSNVEEALQLRQGGIRMPILVLGYTPALCAELLARHGITQCVYSADYGYRLAEGALHAGVRVKIHIKLDTGMGRIGFLCRSREYSELEQVLSVCQQPSLDPEGLFTHFSSADSAEGEEETKLQRDRFREAEQYLRERGLVFSIRHCANSAGILRYEDSHMDMIRAGIVLYGFPPADGMVAGKMLVPVMTVRAVVSHVKDIPARSGYMRAQTPQAFHFDIVFQAYAQAVADDSLSATDDAGIVRKYAPGCKIFIVAGDETNRKITYKEDL